MKTAWHILVGETLRTLLQPVGIDVLLEVPVVVDAPKADLILIRRQPGGWTREQRLLLADGIRDLEAERILIELKITESLTDAGLSQLAMYDTLYRNKERLPRSQLQSILISSSSTRRETLDRFGFVPVGPEGVHESRP
ncbi:MAG: hypothetical protein HQL76_17280, partial [Magnetococcales bacterium]|nr:hypothetical protein [Magnetococcales bacterium]